MKEADKTIWTIGHSTRSPEKFVAILHSFNIDVIADNRSFPGSRKFPQFIKEALEVAWVHSNLSQHPNCEIYLLANNVQ